MVYGERARVVIVVHAGMTVLYKLVRALGGFMMQGQGWVYGRCPGAAVEGSERKD